MTPVPLSDLPDELKGQTVPESDLPITKPVEQKPGFIASIGEMITGSRRATPETQTLPEWTGMPELNQMSVASFKTALGTLLSNPKETVQILKANFPGVQVRQDAKGNYLMRSSVDQKEYAIPPGFTMGDIPRALGGIAAFTPARAPMAALSRTIPGAVAFGAGTQAAIEATQAGTGGTFDVANVGMAGAGGAFGLGLQKGIQAATPIARQALQRIRQRPVTQPGAPMAAVPETVPAQQAATQTAPVAVAPKTVPSAAIPETVAAIPETDMRGAVDVLGLAKKASGIMPGSTAAREKLAELSQINPQAKQMADQLGIDLPIDVFADNPQVRSAVGLTRALVGGEAEAAWEKTLRNFMSRGDEISQQFDAAFIEGRPATGAVSENILNTLKTTRSDLNKEARQLYDAVDNSMQKSSTVELSNLRQSLDEIISEVGENGLKPQEKNLFKILDEGNITYGRLLREKDSIGKAIGGLQSEYGDMTSATLKRLYGALAKDQLDNVAVIGGDDLAKQLKAANLLTAKQKGLENRIIGAFGKEIDGSVGNLIVSSISGAAGKGGSSAQFNKLMKVMNTVPDELKRQTLATGLAAVTQGRAAGRAGAEVAFSPTEYVKVYRGLRANPPVYAQFAKIMGKDWEKTSQALYELSKRVADASARIPQTGKANQILAENAVNGITGKVMESAMAQRIATGVASTVPGGGFIAPDIVKWMTNSGAATVQKASDLFKSPEFQKLAVEAATKGTKVSEQQLRKLVLSQQFKNFARAANLPIKLEDQMIWIRSGLTAVSTQEQQ